MKQPNNSDADKAIFARIKRMVGDEKALRELMQAGGVDGRTEHEQLIALEQELDQCWDLLRQRNALRSAGINPDEARVRPAATVEKYQS
ncbi:DUF2630 family protein [Streptomyces sp. NPDC054775]